MNYRSLECNALKSVVTLLNQCMTADPINAEVFQQKVLLDQNFDPRGAIVAYADGEVAGFGLGVVRKYPLEDAAPDYDRSWITLLAVDDKYRRQGIASQIVSYIEEYFRQCGCKITYISSYAPNYFIPGVDVQAYSGGLEFFRAIGYSEVCRPLSMSANLTDFQIPEWVIKKKDRLTENRIVIEAFQPELILPLLDFVKVEFPGDWQRCLRETMTRITLGEHSRDSLLIAHCEGNVLGFCQHDNTGRFGPFGVAGSERGKGIGAVLLFDLLQGMRLKGFQNAWFLWTDDITARLYARAGFMETRRFALLKKQL